jgi:hypothetical protein
MIEVVVVLASTRNVGVGRCHVFRIYVGIVTKKYQSRCQKIVTQPFAQVTGFKHQTICCGPTIFDGQIQNSPTLSDNAWQLRPNFFLSTKQLLHTNFCLVSISL